MDTVHPLFVSQPIENLTAAAQRWGRQIEASLQHLAQTVWADEHQLTKNSSTQQYRLGQRSTPNSQTTSLSCDKRHTVFNRSDTTP